MGRPKGYQTGCVDGVHQPRGWTVEGTARAPEATGCAGISTRWIVERTLAWRMRNRRLRKDTEFGKRCRATYLYLASIRLVTMRRTCVIS